MTAAMAAPGDLAAGAVGGRLWRDHGVWDVVRLKLDKVVARSFAEWCAIIDVVIGIELLLKL